MTNGRARSPTMEKDCCMKTTASDVLIDSIHDWGVDVVFRLPGDGINGIQDALRKEHSEVPNTDFPLRRAHSGFFRLRVSVARSSDAMV